MSLESATYISDLVVTNPTGTDGINTLDNHDRLIKTTIKQTFPNITGAMNATHTELNYSVGVTSAIQTQIDAKGAITGQAWTGSHTFVTQSAGDNTTKAATTAYVDAADALKANLASPTLTGTPLAPTATPGTNTTQLATTAFVVAQAFSAVLPAQGSAAGKFLTTDGSTASWANITNQVTAKAALFTLATTDRYSVFKCSGTWTATLLAAATAGNGFINYWMNTGTGIITLDPNGAETITTPDGTARATTRLYPNETAITVCDGSGWIILRPSGRVLIETQTIGAAVAAVNCETGFDDTEFKSFEVRIDGLSTTSTGQAPLVRTKQSGSYATRLTFANSTGATAASSFQIDVLSPFSTVAHGAALVVAGWDGLSGLTIASNVSGGASAAVLQGVGMSISGDTFDAGTFRTYGYR